MPASVVWIGLGCVLVIYLFSFGWNPGARVAPGRFWGWTGSPVAGVERQERQPCRDAAAELDDHAGASAAAAWRNPARAGTAAPDPAPHRRRQRSRGVVVPAGDVPAGVDHDHEHRARRQRGEHAVTEHGHSDGEGEEERADRL